MNCNGKAYSKNKRPFLLLSKYILPYNTETKLLNYNWFFQVKRMDSFSGETYGSDVNEI